jgi:CHASE2 domain-containing sensor protein
MKFAAQLPLIWRALKEDWRRPACIITSVLFGFFLLIFSLKTSFYSLSYDWLAGARQAYFDDASFDDPVVLLLDNATIKHFTNDIVATKRRDILAAAIESLFDKYQARAVVLDVFLDLPGTGDEALERVLREKNVFILVLRHEGKGPFGSRMWTNEPPASNFVAAVSNRIGILEQTKSAVVRRFLPHSNSLPRVVARDYRAAKNQTDLTESLAAQGKYWVNYYRAGAILSTSFCTLYTNAAFKDFARGKTVFIGGAKDALTAHGSDVHFTPGGSEHGVMILATMTRNLIDDTAILEPTPGTILWVLLWSLALSSAVALVGPWQSPRPGMIHKRYLRRVLALLAGCSLGLVLVGAGLFYFGKTWMPWTVHFCVQAPVAGWALWIGLVPAKNKFDVFISYRRLGGDKLARIVKQGLARHELRCFLDTDDLKPGNYEKQLFAQLQSAPVVVLITSPELFEPAATKDSFVTREMALAQKLEITVIPFGEEVSLSQQYVPDDIGAITLQQGVTYNHKYADASLQKLAEQVKTAMNAT